MPATPISGQRVLSLPVMASVAYVPASISRFVCMEVVEAPRPAFRQRSNVTVMRIKAVVDMAEKAVRAVKPGASSNKHPADKPIGPVITVRSTVIWGIVEVPVRTHGSRSDVYVNGNLGLHHRCTAQKASYENCESKRTDFEHDFSLIPFIVSTWTAKGQMPSSTSVDTSLRLIRFLGRQS
jgi:hypothetical protein